MMKQYYSYIDLLLSYLKSFLITDPDFIKIRYSFFSCLRTIITLELTLASNTKDYQRTEKSI